MPLIYILYTYKRYKYFIKDFLDVFYMSFNYDYFKLDAHSTLRIYLLLLLLNVLGIIILSRLYSDIQAVIMIIIYISCLTGVFILYIIQKNEQFMLRSLK